MLKKIFIIIGSLVSSLANNGFAQDAKFNKIPNREIILLLDDKNNIMESVEKTLKGPIRYESPTDNPSGMGAMTITSIIAMHQKAAPIIISRPLIENIIYHKQIFKDFATKDTKDLVKKYSKYNRFKNINDLKSFRQNCKYIYKKHKELNKCLHKLLTNTDTQDLLPEITKIISDKKFNINNAPKALNFINGSSKNYSIYSETMLYFLCYNSMINMNKWVIKKISKDLCLLIPKDYVANIETYTAKQLVKSCNKLDKCTPAENKLGLKVNHLKDISSLKEYLKKPNKSKKIKNITHYLAKVFTEKQDKQNIIWSVYIAGHGFPEVQLKSLYRQLKKLEALYTKKSRKLRNIQNAKKIKSEISYVKNKISNITDNQKGIIVSLTKQEFQDLLLFFNDKIDTVLMYYTSCFSGGELLIKPYKKDNQDIILNYNVISGTLAENIALQEMPTIKLPPYSSKINHNIPVNQKLELEDIDKKHKNLKLKTTLQYQDFFNSLRNGLHLDTKNLPLVVFNLHPYTDRPCGAIRNECLGNIPSVRLAGNNKFEVIPHDNSFIIMDQDYIQKHESKANLSPDKATLLYADHIKPEISFSKKTCKQIPACISMKPGFAIHTFEHISAPEFDLSEIMNSFLCFPELSASKMFFIKKLKCSKSKKLNKYSKDKTVELTDVVVMRNIVSSDSLDNKKPGRPPLDTCIYFTEPNTRSSLKVTWDEPMINEKNYKIRPSHLNEHKNEMLAHNPELQKYISETTIA